MPPDTDTQTGHAASPRTLGAIGVLEGLHRTVQGLALYSSEHPSVGAAAAALAERVRGAVPSERLTLGVARAWFLLGDEELRSDALAPLAEALYTLDIGVIEFAPGLDRDQALALAITLCDATKAALAGAPLAEEVDRCTGGRVTLRPMSFAGLHVRDRAESGADDAPAITWATLIEALVNTTDPGAVAAAASHVDREVSRDAAGAAYAAGQTILHACTSTEHEPDGVDRIRAFVASLNPRTRDGILRACLPRARRDALEGIARVFDPAETIASLEALERAGAGLSHETMNLFQKLSGLDASPGATPPPHPSSAAPAPGNDTDSDPFGAVLAGDVDHGAYTPADYGAEIDACAAHRSESVTASPWRFSDSDVALRKAQIGLELLRESAEADAARPDAIFEHLIANLDAMIDSGDVTMIARTVRAAQRRAYIDATDDLDDPARRFLAEINDPDRVRRIIDGAWSAGKNRAEAVALFRDADFLIVHLPRMLAADTPDDVSRSAGEILLEIPEAQLLPLVESLATTDLVALRAMLDALASLAGPLLSRVAPPLMGSANPAVRRMAFGAMTTAGAPWPPRLIARGLADPDHGVQRATLEHLEPRTDTAALEALAEFLRGAGPSGRQPWRDTFRKAACTLAGAGAEGLRLACAVLEQSLASAGRAGAARSRELADILADHRADPHAARALARWARSGARVVATLTRARLPQWEARR